MKDCKECLNSRLVISENGYKPICTLSYRESNKCLLNDKCKFEANQLYLMVKDDFWEELPKPPEDEENE